VNAVWTIAGKEIHDAFRNRWLVFYAVAFAALALLISYLGERNLGGLGFENFSRTTASLINLCLLLSPLVALAVSAGSIAGEQERGNLTYLLAQPLERWEVVIGKYAGVGLSIAIATIAGFGIAGIVIAFYANTMDATSYLYLLGLVLALVAVMTGIGLVASAASATRVQALGVALLVWFFTVLVFDLVLIGLVSNANLEGRALLAGLLLNPVEIVRVLAIIHLEPDLEVLGPFGSFIVEDLGTGMATAVLIASLAVWIAGPIAAAVWLFNDRKV
jgi:Cu-processing system permease protein